MRVSLSRKATYMAVVSTALVAAAAGAYVALRLLPEAAPNTAAVEVATRAADTTATRSRPVSRRLSKDAAAKLQRTADASNAGALFAVRSWYVAPPPAPPPPAPPPVVPTAPPLPYTFMGSYTESGQDTVYFLSSGDRVYDVHLGDTLDQTYSVDAVENGALVFTYKPLSTRQLLALGSGS